MSRLHLVLGRLLLQVAKLDQEAIHLDTVQLEILSTALVGIEKGVYTKVWGQGIL